MRRILVFLSVVAVAALVVVGLGQAGSGGDAGTATATTATDVSVAELKAAVAGAPAPFDALYAQSSQVLEGGEPALRERLRELRGVPVVVNKWASWCTPCRFEFPFFRQEAIARKGKVAFLGLNSADNRKEAEKFLAEEPLPFPSYEDPDERIARSLKAPANFPITIFYDAQGERVYIHQGAYRSQADLAADIERYALG